MQVPINQVEGQRPIRPLFVIGMWRSGTSALYALLNQHPQIALLYEGDLHLLSSQFMRRRGASDIVARWDFWNTAARRHRIEPEQLPAKLADAKSALRASYEVYARRKGASIAGEKSPNYYDRVTELAREFPDARFLVIWRNPFSVCASIVAARSRCFWFDRRGMVLRALVGFSRLKRQCDEVRKQGASLLEINYEDLVSDTDGVMRRICGFLEIPFDPRMTSLDHADVSAIYPEEHHSKVRREGIHLMPERSYLIPSDIREKIERYVGSWREVFPSWAVNAGDSRGAAPRLGRVEATLDQVAYGALRFYDRMILLLYSAGPLWPLKTYRIARNWYRRYSHDAGWQSAVPQLRRRHLH
jgi:hypothetical protein